MRVEEKRGYVWRREIISHGFDLLDVHGFDLLDVYGFDLGKNMKHMKFMSWGRRRTMFF